MTGTPSVMVEGWSLWDGGKGQGRIVSIRGMKHQASMELRLCAPPPSWYVPCLETFLTSPSEVGATQISQMEIRDVAQDSLPSPAKRPIALSIRNPPKWSP